MRLSNIIVFAAALALGACNQAAAPENGAQPASSGEASNASGGAAPTSSLWNAGQSRSLDIQVAHANGVVLQLTSIQSRATDTAVGLRIINGRQRDIDLNRFPDNRNGYLLLDSGERLYLSPPTTNARLTVPAGQTFEGELVFLGRLPRVNTAILVLNENMSGDSEHTDTPGFRVDLPLTAVSGGTQ